MADQSTPREMRIVEMEDGWATAVEMDQTVMGWPMVGMLATTGVAMAGLVANEHMAWLALMFLGPLAMLAFPMMSWQHFRLRSHGLELSRLYTRGLPKIVHIRTGDGGPMLVLRREATRELAFSEMRGLGFTDYSVWFDMNGERVEVILEKTARGDIERLHGEIEAVWKQYRAGLTDTEEEAAARREQLRAVAARTGAKEGG